MHSTVFSIGSPVVVSRCGLLELWTKFCIAFDEAMQDVEFIGNEDCDRLRVSAVRNDSSHLYFLNHAFPLSITVKVTDFNAKTTSAHLHACLYLNKETSEVVGFVDIEGAQKCHGDVDSTLKQFSAELLKQLQAQAVSAQT